MQCGYLVTSRDKDYVIINVEFIQHRRIVWRKSPSTTTVRCGWKGNSRSATQPGTLLICQAGPRSVFAAVDIRRTSPFVTVPTGRSIFSRRCRRGLYRPPPPSQCKSDGLGADKGQDWREGVLALCWPETAPRWAGRFRSVERSLRSLDRKARSFCQPQVPSGLNQSCPRRGSAPQSVDLDVGVCYV